MPQNCTTAEKSRAVVPFCFGGRRERERKRKSTYSSHVQTSAATAAVHALLYTWLHLALYSLFFVQCQECLCVFSDADVRIASKSLDPYPNCSHHQSSIKRSAAAAAGGGKCNLVTENKGRLSGSDDADDDADDDAAI